MLTAIWAVGTCHRPLSWIAGHSYCPLPLLLMRYNTAAVWFSQPEIVSLMSLSLRAIRAVLDCPTSSLLLSGLKTSYPLLPAARTGIRRCLVANQSYCRAFVLSPKFGCGATNGARGGDASRDSRDYGLARRAVARG